MDFGPTQTALSVGAEDRDDTLKRKSKRLMTQEWISDVQEGFAV